MYTVDDILEQKDCELTVGKEFNTIEVHSAHLLDFDLSPISLNLLLYCRSGKNIVVDNEAIVVDREFMPRAPHTSGVYKISFTNPHVVFRSLPAYLADSMEWNVGGETTDRALSGPRLEHEHTVGSYIEDDDLTRIEPVHVANLMGDWRSEARGNQYTGLLDIRTSLMTKDFDSGNFHTTPHKWRICAESGYVVSLEREYFSDKLDYYI